MTTTALPVPSRTASTPLVSCGYAGLIVAALCMLTLHLTAWREVDPRTDVMSLYALVHGVGWMFGVMLGGVSVACVAAAVTLRRNEVGGLVLFGLALGSAGAWVAGVFPTTAGDALDMSAQLHRYGALTMMISVTAAGVVASRRVRCRRLGALSLVTAFVLTFSLLSNIDVMPPELLEVKGLLQRAAVAGMVIVLARILALTGGAATARPTSRLA